MGIELILGVASLATGAASTIAQRAQARRAARSQRTANAIQGAQQTVENNLARRRAAREERVRRGRLIAASENTGASGSSGEFGALSALSTNTGAAISEQRGQELAARGITAANQSFANAQSRFETIGAFAGVVQQGLNLFSDNDE
jgi:hypothetical protein